MAISHPFQKNITVHREKADKDFLCIKNAHWMEANRLLTPYGLQLYLYLASNRDGYNFNLSQEDAEQSAGIHRTTFHKYVNLMIEKGYLVKSKGNCYDFYETPQIPPDQSQNPANESIDETVFSFFDF